jgi:hypothetical protein
MQTIGKFGAILCGVVLATAAPAAADCECIYAGGTAKEGTTICLQTQNGFRLAKCGKVLNNTSWAFSDTECTPVSQSSLPKHTPLKKVAQTIADASLRITDREALQIQRNE